MKQNVMLDQFLPCYSLRFRLPNSGGELTEMITFLQKRLQFSNSIISQHLIGKRILLGLNTSRCEWNLHFLSKRPQSIGTTVLSRVPSPRLFTLVIHDFAAMHSSNHTN